jgi:hypothetical protein
MKKIDVERVLEKSLEFWRVKVKENISLIDLHELSFIIWNELETEGYIAKDDDDDQKIQEYWLTISDLRKMELLGHKIILEGDGREIHLIVKDFFERDLVLESGKKFV